MSNKISKCTDDGPGSVIHTPDDKFLLKGGIDIKITELIVAGVREITIDNIETLAPTITSSVSPASAEVGDTVATGDYRFTANTQTNPISVITITPDPGGAVPQADVEKQFDVLNVTSNSPGLAGVHAIFVEDDSGNDTSKNIGIQFLSRIYQGFYNLSDIIQTTPRDMTQAAVEAILVNSDLAADAKALYGGSNNYKHGVPGFNRFIYWMGPTGTPKLVSALLGGLDFPLVELSTVNVTNSFGLVVPYWVVRSAIEVGDTTLTLNLSFV